MVVEKGDRWKILMLEGVGNAATSIFVFLRFFLKGLPYRNRSILIISSLLILSTDNGQNLPALLIIPHSCIGL